MLESVYRRPRNSKSSRIQAAWSAFKIFDSSFECVLGFLWIGQRIQKDAEEAPQQSVTHTNRRSFYALHCQLSQLAISPIQQHDSNEVKPFELNHWAKSFEQNAQASHRLMAI